MHEDVIIGGNVPVFLIGIFRLLSAARNGTSADCLLVYLSKLSFAFF